MLRHVALRVARVESSAPAVPALVFAAGVGLIGSGLFVTDPVAGFPPERAPASGFDAVAQVAPTRGGQLHNLCAIPIFVGLPVAALVSAGSAIRRREYRGQRIALVQRLVWLPHVRSSGRLLVARRRSFLAEVSSSASRSQPDSDGSAPSHSARCAQRRKAESLTSPEAVADAGTIAFRFLACPVAAIGLATWG